MISIEVFNTLKESETSSWAIWNEDNKNDLDFFVSNLERLHGNAIFVGLNRSNIANNLSSVASLSNFHTKGHTGDKRLKKFIQDKNLSNLIGGFMTDISDEIETKSSLVMVKSKTAFDNFVEKTRLLGTSEIRHIICFGDKVFNTFAETLQISKSCILQNLENKIKEFACKVVDETWHIYRAWHYSNYGIFIHKSEIELPVQLKYIDDKSANL